MKIRAIFFDLFHTLVDVGSVPLSVGRYTADILGLDREQWNAACFGPAHDICHPSRHLEVIRSLAHSLDPLIPEALIVEAAAQRQARFDHALRNVEASVLESLSILHAEGYRLGLISNASSGEVAAWGESPLAARFEHALFSCDCGSCKPHADIYMQALSRFGLEAGEVLFVGDGGSDEHRGARALGLGTVLMSGYLSDERRQQRRPLVDHEVGAITELPGLLARLSG